MVERREKGRFKSIWCKPRSVFLFGKSPEKTSLRHKSRSIILLICGLCFGLVIGGSSDAKVFRWATEGSIHTLDPHAFAQSDILSFHGAIFDALTRYDSNLDLEPSLALNWTQLGPTTWRFDLRGGVVFHNGSTFSAEDVVFTWRRARDSDRSQYSHIASRISDIEVLDDLTILMHTTTPDPLLPKLLSFLFIVDRDWTVEHGRIAVDASSFDALSGQDPAGYVNGTGPFRVRAYNPSREIVIERFDQYWEELDTNVEVAVHSPMPDPAARVTALISGERDLVYPVPVEDWPLIESIDGTHMKTSAGLRVMVLKYDVFRPELLYSGVKGRNPFQDRRVRQAVALAINTDVLVRDIVRGGAARTGTLIPPQADGFSAELDVPYPYDPEKARIFLEEAGYPNGFDVTLDCPNDRYINDEEICRAIAGFLRNIGIRVHVNALPRSVFFPKIALPRADTSLFLIGWVENTLDGLRMLENTLAFPDSRQGVGRFNQQRYRNEEMEALLDRVRQTTDPAERSAVIAEALALAKEDFAMIPLYREPLTWGLRDGVVTPQPANNILNLRDVVVAD